MTNEPTSSIDLFSDEVLDDPYPHYRELRQTGAAVRLDSCDAWALPRYTEIRRALRDWETYSSASGVGLNDAINLATEGTVIASDPPEHSRLRGILYDRLSPKALREVAKDIEQQADALVDELVARGSFDAMEDLAVPFPTNIVGNLIGLRPDSRDELLSYSEATWNAVGPVNDRTIDALGQLEPMFEALMKLSRDQLIPGSLGLEIYDAADRGEIPQDQCAPMMWAYTGAGVETTIASLGNAVWLFAEHPDQWDVVRSNPGSIPGAFNEIVRYDPPIQAFSRLCRHDVTIDDVDIAEGSRVLLLYGSGNRDERHYEDPDRFDVTRNPLDHLGFGYGIHTCAGAALARIQVHAVLAALARRVTRFHASEPKRRLNNITRQFSSLPVSVQI